jgi:class 3 adenylate cyclase
LLIGEHDYTGNAGQKKRIKFLPMVYIGTHSGEMFYARGGKSSFKTVGDQFINIAVNLAQYLQKAAAAGQPFLKIKFPESNRILLQQKVRLAGN